MTRSRNRAADDEVPAALPSDAVGEAGAPDVGPGELLQPRGWVRLGDALVEHGHLTTRQLDVALAEQRQVQRPLGEILVDLGFVSGEVVARHLAESLGLPLVRGKSLSPDPMLLSGLEVGFVRDLKALPLRFEGDRLVVAMVDPSDPHLVARIRKHFSCELELQMMLESDLGPLIRRHFPESAGDVSALVAVERDRDSGGEFPVERFTEALLVDGVRRGATDLHLHPEEGVTRVRFRIDGVLRQIDVLPRDATPGVVSRLKILARLDISERRRPQDGRMRIEVDGRAVDLRASFLPTNVGESVVLRVLDRASGSVPLEDLGIAPGTCALLRRVAERPHGLFLVTGPTGSGKTTTLYSLLAEVDSLQRNVATVEDPVEYSLPLIRQSQVESAVGFDFQTGLRALLRQDPDVILVGEIRDHETAAMAIKASMTGHLVLSTLHTNTAIGAIPRLVDLGVQPYLIEDSLIGVLAQRLVRRVCGSCARDHDATDEECAWLGAEVATLSRGVGCKQCDETGYAGRSAISELFLPDDAIAVRMRAGANFVELYEAAREAGFEDMLADGRRKVLAGATTAAEVLRVHRSHRLDPEERVVERVVEREGERDAARA